MDAPLFSEQNKTRLLIRFIMLVLLVGLLLVASWPESQRIPVQGGASTDWHQQTFWYEPWGASGVHKGIDIFAKKGTPLLAATSGWVVYRSQNSIGGKVYLILGAKWRLHYYAHLDTFKALQGDWVKAGEPIGTVGDSGNAAGKQAHVHYSIFTLLPYPWRIDSSTQGWKKMFYLNPGEFLLENK